MEAALVDRRERSEAELARVIPLFPKAVHDRDLLTALHGVARFVRVEGYWPKAKELTARMKCDHAGLISCLHELLAKYLLDRTPHQSGAAAYRLTEAGWNFLGLQPIEPWRKRPSKMLIRRAIDAAALRVRRLQDEENS